MAKHVGDRGGIAAWREAHDAMGELLEAAEGADSDAQGKVAVDFAACRDGYGQLAGLFAPRGAGARSSADSARGMALDKRSRRPGLDVGTVDDVFPTRHPQRNHG